MNLAKKLAVSQLLIAGDSGWRSDRELREGVSSDNVRTGFCCLVPRGEREDRAGSCVGTVQDPGQRGLQEPV